MGCDPELDVLWHISSSVLVAELVRCTDLCLSSVLISVTWTEFLSLATGPRSVFSILFSLVEQLSCSCPGRKDTLHPLVTFAPSESLLSVVTTLPFLPILSITWFVLLKPPLYLHNLQFSWEKPELLGFLASSFSTFPFVLSLILASSFFSFLSFPFSCPGNSVCPVSSFCGISDMILHPCCCRTAAVMCLGHSPPDKGSHLASLIPSFLLSSLFKMQQVRPFSSPITWPTRWQLGHFSTFFFFLSCSSSLIPNFSRPEVTLLAG